MSLCEENPSYYVMYKYSCSRLKSECRKLEAGESVRELPPAYLY
jgi:hypothetical protein